MSKFLLNSVINCIRYIAIINCISFQSKKFPEDELIELFGEGSGDLTSEKFHPGWFLLQHHHATTLEDLKAGLAYLRRKVNSQKEGQLSFLKVNK